MFVRVQQNKCCVERVVFLDSLKTRGAGREGRRGKNRAKELVSTEERPFGTYSEWWAP